MSELFWLSQLMDQVSHLLSNKAINELVPPNGRDFLLLTVLYQ